MTVEMERALEVIASGRLAVIEPLNGGRALGSVRNADAPAYRVCAWVGGGSCTCPQGERHTGKRCKHSIALALVTGLAGLPAALPATAGTSR